jgi:predicted NACHT family NTPase
MDPVTAAVTALVASIDWKEIFKKFVGDSAKDLAKAGRASFLRRLQPDESQKLVKQAVVLFSEEFLKELIDKAPESSIPGFHDQLKRLIESATPDIAQWLRPEVKDVDLGAVATMWSGLKLDPLPDFDWKFVAGNYERAIRAYIRKNPELRDQLAIALQEESRDFEQRFSPGFDLTGYRDFLLKKCATLQLSAMHTSAYDRRIGLWSVFVPQSARESAPVRDIPREILRQLRKDGYIMDDPDEDQIARVRESYQSSPVLPVLEILAHQRLVVLLGDPGSGKTSLLKYLVLQWVTEDRGPLPLWIDLREYARQPIGIKQYLESGPSSYGFDARKTEEQLRAGQAALYLDGLDEVFDLPVRSIVIEEVTAFSARYPQAVVIVTSRIIGYEPERLRNAGFTHATLEDFDDDQILAFLHQWHDVSEADDPGERERLLPRLSRAIEESRAIRELAGNPLLLTMMAILNRNQELPRDRVELYREASRVLLHEWDASRSLLPTDVFARQEKEALLRELAGEMQQTEGGLAGNLIERDRLLGIFRDFLKALGIQDSYIKAGSLVQQLTERNFILCFAGADRFAFVHRTFLEYFCAAWFVDQYEKRRTLSLDQLKYEVFGSHWWDEKWHEVLRLIAGMIDAKQAEDLIQFLMSQDGRAQEFDNLMLAAGCLSEVRSRRAIGDTDHSLRKVFIEKVIRFDPPYYYEKSDEWEETGPTRAKAVSWIGSLWRSQKTRDWLLSTAQGDSDWIVRRAALEALARGWKDDSETLPWLRDRARSDEYYEVRMAAVLEVVRGWRYDPGTLPWLKDHARSDKDNDVPSAALQELARGWKDDPDTLPLLKDRARSDEDNEVRMAALQELARGWKDDPDTLPLVKDRARSDENYEVRRAGLLELVRGWKDDPDTLPLVKDRVRSDENDAVRVAALRELARGWKDGPDTLPWLRNLARSDENDAVRRAAVQELARGWKDGPDTLPWLKDCARSDKNYSVRCAAVQELAISWKADPDTLPLLKDLARSDENVSVRFAALRELAWGWKDDADTLPLLKNSSRSDKHHDVRRAALRELSRDWKDDPDTLPLLKDSTSSDKDHDVRRAALRELSRGWRDDPDTLLLLKERARSDENYGVRKAALRELARGWKDDPEVVALLSQAK